MAKGDITRTVLEGIAELGEVMLDSFFPKKYAYAAIWRPLFGLEGKKKVDRHTISAILWRLRRQGLVERMGARRQSRWRLTAKGKKFQSGLSRRSVAVLPEPDGISRLVIFDIPERERKKRTTIRAELAGCNFRQLQKSVWIGECPLPKKFIELVDDLDLAEHLHIFSIRDKGTIGDDNL